MGSSSLLLLSLLGALNAVQGLPEFRVCAFNLHNFGESKSKNQDVMQILSRIITRCDVCLLQEVRDRKEKAIPELLRAIQRYDTKHSYRVEASERLGRSESYKEQYVFVYRADTTTLTGRYQYPDNQPGDEDAFSREPFIVRMRAPQTDIADFVLVAQHTAPSNATKELDALYDVLQHVKRMWRTQNVMLLGDFNADCDYLAKKNRVQVRLITDTNLFWLIPDHTDTTVRSSTSCAYDRIVVNGPTFHRLVVPSSAKAFNFQQEYSLTEDQALDVSDHYPVEVLLRVSIARSSGRTISWMPSSSHMLSLVMTVSLMALGHAVGR